MDQQPSSSSRSDSIQVLVDANLAQDDLQQLREREGLCVTVADPVVETESVVRPAQLIADVQFLLCSYLPRNLSDMRQLKLLQLASSGYSQIQGLGLSTRGVHVCNARGVNDTAIAEWNVAMMINLSRSLPRMLKNQELHVWDRANVFQTEIHGTTVGIWGYGGIGRQTARLCKALGLKVHVLVRSEIGPIRNRYCVPDLGDTHGILPDRVFPINECAEFLKTLNFLILCLSLNSATEGIVGEDELRALPKSAFVLNPARGPLIQQTALLHALREGWIAGAAIDTHHQYPMPSEHPLWSFENVILTPHITGSSGSTHFTSRLASLFSQNIDRLLSDQPLLNELSPYELGD